MACTTNSDVNVIFELEAGIRPRPLPRRLCCAGAVSAGVTAGIMQLCALSDLICVLPLKVALNREGKRRLIWDCHHVNACPREEP